MQEHVIQINFIDSPRLGYEIFKLTDKHKIDKIAMEVNINNEMVIRVRSASESCLQKLMKDLKLVKGVMKVKFRKQMPSEEREQELSTILNSISEGVIAVDKGARIININRFACHIFHCQQSEVMGLPVEELLTDMSPILSTLYTGKHHRLKEQKINRDGRIIHFMISSMPVKNNGEISGAVATIKDFHQVETIISKADRTRKMVTFEDLVHQSVKMRTLIGHAKTVAKSNSIILIRGESGTGKELFAKAIHNEGPRHKAKFIAINCAALPDTLLESELFGYEEGAFTGALKGGKKGLFEEASQGTLFLDEIGEISAPVQVKLLRVLQEGTIRRVGGSKEIAVDVRIIAATHRNLEEMTRRGEFREDLYYRLNVIPIVIPPLRERKEDIPLLTIRLVEKICKKLEKPMVRVAKNSIDLLMEQKWPGNVRQLENTLERLINLVDAVEIEPVHLETWGDITVSTLNAVPKVVDEQNVLKILMPADDQWPKLKDIIADVEKKIITKVLKKYPSSRLAGQALGVSNTTILNKMKVHDIK